MKRRNEVAVGILVTVALVLLVVGSLWLARGGLSRGYPLYTRFAWGQNLKEGQPVLLAGVSIGYVDNVDLEDGFLGVRLSIAKSRKVPMGSMATVVPVGIFGDVAIALNPPMPVPHTYYAVGDTIPPGTPIPGIADILLRVDSLSESVLRLEHSFETDFVNAGGVKDIKKATASAVALTEQLQREVATQSANLTVTMKSFRDAGTQVAQAVTRLSTVLDSAKIDSALKNVRTASATGVRVASQFDSATHQLRHILAQIDSGQGDLGLFLHDRRLYDSVEENVLQFQSLLTDLQAHPKKYVSFSIFGH